MCRDEKQIREQKVLPISLWNILSCDCFKTSRVMLCQIRVKKEGGSARDNDISSVKSLFNHIKDFHLFFSRYSHLTFCLLFFFIIKFYLFFSIRHDIGATLLIKCNRLYLVYICTSTGAATLIVYLLLWMNVRMNVNIMN